MIAGSGLRIYTAWVRAVPSTLLNKWIRLSILNETISHAITCGFKVSQFIDTEGLPRRYVHKVQQNGNMCVLVVDSNGPGFPAVYKSAELVNDSNNASDYAQVQGISSAALTIVLADFQVFKMKQEGENIIKRKRKLFCLFRLVLVQRSLLPYLFSSYCTSLASSLWHILPFFLFFYLSVKFLRLHTNFQKKNSVSHLSSPLM